MPLGALSIGLLGFVQLSIPLAQLLPEGQVGCSLLTSLDVPILLAAGIGTAQSAFLLANDPSLLGASFFQQTIPLSFDGSGALAAVRGSNALAVVIGTL